MFEYGNFVGGEWRPGEASLATFNPARPSQQIGRYVSASGQLVDDCVRHARRAQREWRLKTDGERAQTLLDYSKLIEERVEEIATAITLEQGKPLAESRGEVGKSCAEARFTAQHAFASAGARAAASLRPNVRNFVQRRPRGVIVAISPWNFPVLTPMRKIAPAVAYGNAVLLKPSEFTPAASCLLVELTRGIFPNGLVQLVHGGGDIGHAMVSHPDVDGVTFTGSVATGQRILQATSANLAECSLELGGKNAAVIHETNDLGSVIDSIVQAAYMCAGQRCTAVSRVFVRRELYDEALRLLCHKVGALRIGDGMAKAVQVGPLTHAAQFERVKAMTQRAVNDGARISTGGRPREVENCDGGYFFAPTVLTNVAPESEAGQEEIFGPVVTVSGYDGFDEAIGLLNGVRYGLTASLFARDARTIERFASECETGMIHVNHGTVPDSHMPFGGIKASGLGAYSVGPSAAAFYTTEHSVYLQA